MQQKAEPLEHKAIFNDPMFEDQWHLRNIGQFGGKPGVDANLMGAWDMGFSGNGVRIAFVDDGVQYTHPDLAEGYRPDSSYDVVEDKNDAAPGMIFAIKPVIKIYKNTETSGPALCNFRA